jgi:hypothetical protein
VKEAVEYIDTDGNGRLDMDECREFLAQQVEDMTNMYIAMKEEKNQIKEKHYSPAKRK